ncbi:MAG: hypothetical protein HQK77_16900, partial [Desulfobacterales bacterium]|nr:hypothetical protein [Desulfobacterales bacterium]
KNNEKKSFWLQGAYGTGKSHATAVIKHLLFEDMCNLNEFIESFQDIQLKSRIKNLRNKHKAFPVVIKGLSNVTDNRTFALVIEKAVKDSLKKCGLSVGTKSDFEKMIFQIETNPGHINWDSVINSYPQISMYAKNKKDVLKKLKEEDTNILYALELLSSIGIHFSQNRIDEWLTEVISDLKKQNKADSLIIFWDEFTSVLQLPNSDILITELQHIAELSKNKDVFLFVVSHKSPLAVLKIQKEDMEKAIGRFQLLDYSMEQITTYHIMGAAIKKKDQNKWTDLKDEKTATTDIDKLIRRIIGTDSPANHYKMIRDLFPIHPYTAYLSTFIARNIGSTERSIFNFLYDTNNGFKRFIEENPSAIGGVFLTCDYLWNFFMCEFERIDAQRFSPVLDKYKLHFQAFEKQSHSYLVVFKGVLLLNILYKMINVSEAKEDLVVPSLLNIKSLFYGTEYSPDTEAALNFFDEKQIISKNPDDLFLISSSSLPIKEIEKEKQNELSRTNSQIDKILSYSQIKEIEDNFTANIIRKSELKIVDASLNPHLLKTKIHPSKFKYDYAIHIALLIAHNIQEKEEIKKSVQTISIESEFNNIIFIIPDTLFDETVFNQFLEYQARANVADRHNFKEDQVSNQEYARKVIENWINNLKNGYIEWYLYQDKGKILRSSFNEIVNAVLSSKMFSFGLETLKEAKKNINVWKEQSANKSAENFLFSDTLTIIIESKKASSLEKHTREILKNNLGEYIVTEELRFKDDVDPNHPLVQMNKHIETEIEKQKNSGVFHLGNTLKFLTKAPFGVYKNMVYFASMGFLMKQYVGKLYELGTGKPIEKDMMRDKIIALFKYWDGGKESSKLDVRLGTIEEKNLIILLNVIFGLNNSESLSDVRWNIRNWINESQYPLWVFKWDENIYDDTKTAIDLIIDLTESIDTEITQTDIKTTLTKIEAVKTDLCLLLQKTKTYPLFIIFLKHIDNIEFKEEDINDIIQYIRQNMSEEIGVDSWKESNVREKVKDWYNIQLKKSLDATKKQPHLIPNPVSNPTVVAEPKKPFSKPIQPELKISIIEKIETANETTLKNVLKRMLQEHPEIKVYLETYLSLSW